MVSSIIEKAQQLVIQYNRPRIFKIESNKRILVLAPHPDDEVIGAGGSIIKHRKKDNFVHVGFITDGRNGRLKSSNMDDTITIRRNETAIVCEFLDVEYSWLNAPDGEFFPEDIYIKKIQQLILDVKPDYIYIPHYRDKHRDHFFTNLLLYLSCSDETFREEAILENIEILAYEVWSPLNPNVFVNITEEYKYKELAMKKYTSQIALIPYERIMSGINKYRVSLFPLHSTLYVEAFYHCDCINYCSEFKQYVDRKWRDLL